MPRQLVIFKVAPVQGCQIVYFMTKNPIWIYLGGPWNGECWYILRPFGIIYDHLV
jgi:hypothetical protein